MAQFQCFSKCPLKEQLLQFKQIGTKKSEASHTTQTSKPMGFLRPLLIQLVEVDVSCFLKKPTCYNQPLQAMGARAIRCKWSYH